MIYILDPDEGTRKLLSYSLSRSGINAVELTSAAELFDAIQREAPELIILETDIGGSGQGIETIHGVGCRMKAR